MNDQTQVKTILRRVRQTVGFSSNSQVVSYQLLGNAAGSLVIKAASVGLNVLVPFVLGRWLGAEGYGTYAYVIAWTTILGSVAVLGLDMLVIREVAAARAQARWDVLRGVIFWALRVILMTSLILLTVGGGLLWLLGTTLLGAREALWLVLPVVPLLALIHFWRGSLQGLGRVLVAQLPPFIILPLGLLIFAGVFYLWGHLTAFQALVAYLVALFLACSIGGGLLWRRLKDIPKVSRLEIYSQRWLQSAVPLFLASLVSLINDRVGVLMLGTFVSPEAAGIFDIAFKGSLLVSFPLVALNMALAPVVASLYAKRNRTDLQRLVRLGARAALIGAMPVAVGLIVFGSRFLGLIGTEFVGGETPLAILCIGQLINVGAGPVALILNMTGHERDTLKGLLLSVLVNVLLTYVLMSSWGINAAAVASAISLAVWNGFLVWRVHELVHINPSSC